MKNLFATKPLLLLTALLQGLALLSLHLVIEYDVWPHDQPPWLTAFFTMALGGPLLLLLSLNSENRRKIFIWVGGFTLLSGLLGYYIGWQMVPYDNFDQWSLCFAYIVTMGIAAFKFLMYAQQFSSGTVLSYQNLFQFSWRNFLTLALSGAFTLSFWGILMLWAALFKLVKIDFFYVIFMQAWFYYPVLAVANGFGVIILRNQSKVIDVLTRLQQALMKYLLLILILVSIIFLCVLPFTGLSPLWETKSGSEIILWMQALILFFLNVAYQDEGQPYTRFFHRFVYVGISLLPVYSAISFYGLFLRIDQYGWTVGRCWGVFIWAMFALFSLSYLYGIIKKRDGWIENLGWVNIRMGLFVLFSMLMVNTPLVDFRKISVASQLARLDAGKVDYENFDYRYFKNHLGAPGYQAMEDLKSDLKDSDPEAVLRIEDSYNHKRKPGIGPIKNFRETLVVWPQTETLPQSLIKAIHTYVNDRWWSLKEGGDRYVVVVDLDGDNIKDYLFIHIFKGKLYGRLFIRVDDKWLDHGLKIQGSLSTKNLDEIFKKGLVEVVPSRWKDLKLGKMTLSVRP